MDGEEVKNFRQAVAARENAAKPPPIVPEPVPTSSTKPKASGLNVTAKKDTKKSLKGVLVKKKSKPSGSSASTKSTSKSTEATTPATKLRLTTEDDEQPQTKRRKLAESES
ncbi:hypothetical protein BC835DRAFT_1348810 [Cytidiella melzeri]|nr:hypothetical protein BC835DRAFT_1348810 [Cytidiella melzeri]